MAISRCTNLDEMDPHPSESFYSLNIPVVDTEKSIIDEATAQLDIDYLLSNGEVATTPDQVSSEVGHF